MQTQTCPRHEGHAQANGRNVRVGPSPGSAVQREAAEASARPPVQTGTKSRWARFAKSAHPNRHNFTAPLHARGACLARRSQHNRVRTPTTPHRTFRGCVRLRGATVTPKRLTNLNPKAPRHESKPPDVNIAIRPPSTQTSGAVVFGGFLPRGANPESDNVASGYRSTSRNPRITNSRLPLT